LKLSGGGWGEGNWDCATDAAGSMDISKGNSNFIGLPRFNLVWSAIGIVFTKDYVRNLT
jgi:hypothetical protein